MIFKIAVVIGSLMIMLAGVLVGAVTLGGYIFNPTSSAPIGIWKVTKTKDFKKGDYVLVCPPAHPVLEDLVKRNALLKGRCDSNTVPFIKTVYGVAGDALDTHKDHGVFIEGELIPNTMPYDWPGLELTNGKIIERGEFVALQTGHPASIDSRYFGPLKRKEVIGTMELVWRYE